MFHNKFIPLFHNKFLQCSTRINFFWPVKKNQCSGQRPFDKNVNFDIYYIYSCFAMIAVPSCLTDLNIFEELLKTEICFKQRTSASSLHSHDRFVFCFLTFKNKIYSINFKNCQPNFKIKWW